MDKVEARRGFFSVVRWVKEPARDEAKNLAVVLLDPDSGYGGLRSAPLSSVSKGLKTQGILDSVLAGLEAKASESPKEALNEIGELADSADHSIQFTAPRSTALIAPPEETLDSLYRTFVQPTPSGRADSAHPSKGRVLDRVVTDLRNAGHSLRRSDYVGDFIFDIVIDNGRPASHVGEVFSFATLRKDWTGVEYEAGHFLFALAETSLAGFAVIHPPARDGSDAAIASHDRVDRWLQSRDVDVVSPDEAGQLKI